MAIIVQFCFHLILLSCISVQYSSTTTTTTNDTNYIQCTSRCSQVTVLFNDLFNLPEWCRQEDAYDYALTCSVTYNIHFNQQQVSLNFFASNDTNDLDEQSPKEILIQNTRLYFHEQPEHDLYEITRKYTCNTNKDCAREFYDKTISMLVNAGKDTLNTIKDKLYNSTVLVGETARRQCIDSNKPGTKKRTKCPEGYCYLRLETYSFDEEKTMKSQKCDRPDRTYLTSEIERHKPESTREKEILEYVCNKNVCNRNDYIPKIQHLLNDYIQWNPREQEQNNLHPASPSPDIAEKTGQNLSIKQTLSSSVLVSFIILLQFFI